MTQGARSLTGGTRGGFWALPKRVNRRCASRGKHPSKAHRWGRGRGAGRSRGASFTLLCFVVGQGRPGSSSVRKRALPFHARPIGRIRRRRVHGRGRINNVVYQRRKRNIPAMIRFHGLRTSEIRVRRKLARSCSSLPDLEQCVRGGLFLRHRMQVNRTVVSAAGR